MTREELEAMIRRHGRLVGTEISGDSIHQCQGAYDFLGLPFGNPPSREISTLPRRFSSPLTSLRPPWSTHPRIGPLELRPPRLAAEVGFFDLGVGGPIFPICFWADATWSSLK
ncbi:MAG: hypothetical protein ACE5GN_05625 [Waddliaceae bacterium]